MKLVGETSSVRYEVARKEVLSSFIRYVKSSTRDFVCLVHKRACPHTSGMRNRADYTSSIKYEVTRKESLSSSVWYDVTRKESFSSSVRYEESRIWEFVRPVRSSVKGELVLIRPEQGIKQAGLRPSDTKTCERRACPYPSGTRNQPGCTLSIQYEVTRTEGLSSFVRYEESSRLDFVCLV